MRGRSRAGRYEHGRFVPTLATYDEPEYEIDLTPRPKCPRCLNQLVERTGKRGPFWGCANYPHCRFTASVDTIVEAIRRHAAVTSKSG